MGEYGSVYIDCPVCGESNMLVDNEHSIILTSDNIEFPVHFHHVSEENGAVDACSNEEIRTHLKSAINYFRKHKDEFEWGGWITGNLYLHVHRYNEEEEYKVIISNDFYDMEIPFEPEDYE